MKYKQIQASQIKHCSFNVLSLSRSFFSLSAPPSDNDLKDTDIKLIISPIIS